VISSTPRFAQPGAAVLMIAVLLSGCGLVAESAPHDRIDRSWMRNVAENPDATAEQVVDAGSAVDAASVGGTTLVTFVVHQGTSEGRSAAAWRLYDAHERPIGTEHAGVTTEGAASAAVLAIPDGYLVREIDGPIWRLSLDGARVKVRQAEALIPPQPGDVPLDDGTTRLYRPASGTVFTAAPRADGDRQGWAVTDAGTIWVQRLGRTGQVPFARSSAWGTWEPVASYSPRRGQAVNSLALTAVGGMLVVPVTAEGKDLETATLVGLLMRSDDAPAGQPWELLEAQGIGGTTWWDARASVVDETTVAVGTWGQAPHLVDLTDRTWQRMEPPTAEHGWDYHFEDGTVYATHSEHADAWAECVA